HGPAGRKILQPVRGNSLTSQGLPWPALCVTGAGGRALDRLDDIGCCAAPSCTRRAACRLAQLPTTAHLIGSLQKKKPTTRNTRFRRRDCAIGVPYCLP